MDNSRLFTRISILIGIGMTHMHTLCAVITQPSPLFNSDDAALVGVKRREAGSARMWLMTLII